MPALLSVENLVVHFPTAEGLARAVDGVSLAIEAGEAVGLVGESGCGKSVTALAILRLLPATALVQGRVVFAGRDLSAMKETELRRVRGRDISMIFQEPMTSLNPVFPVGEQIAEVFRLHLGLARRAARAAAVEALARVGFEHPRDGARAYPNQLSGGMRQRVMIAMAMAAGPKLLIADEPTTALDVTIQAQVLALLAAQRAASGCAVLLITHDLGVVAETCERVIVLYAGRVAEVAPVRVLFDRPRHPYTQGLLRAVKRLDEGGVEAAIPGRVDPATHYPPGCRFAPRCPHVMDRCRVEHPPLFLADGTQLYVE
jgi:oligopeptide/dipeptide ABC transporter ATP-binding protein